MTNPSELDALVIRHISDIEGAMKHAKEVVGPRLWAETGEALTGHVDESKWHLFMDSLNEDISLAERTWLTPDSDPVTAQLWLQLGERFEPGGEGDETWLAEFLGAGPQRAKMAIVLNQKLLGAKAWKMLLKANQLLVSSLIEKGFQYDSAASQLFIPWTLDTETLATAFEEDDFNKAMKPMLDAVDIVAATSAELNALFSAARATE